jgi:hypothetical protein
MPRSPDMTSVTLLLSFENRDKLNAFAAENGYPITADYIRHLIETDMRSKGTEIDLSPDRGGYRIRKEDKKDQDKKS